VYSPCEIEPKIQQNQILTKNKNKMKKITLLLVALLFAGAQMLQAQRTITGTVISADDNQSIPGVQVVVKGTTAGTTTNINGQYTLNVPSDATTLVFTFMGMETQEIEIGGRTTIDVVMSSGATTLEGVIITGYGTIRKESFTGALGVVDANVIERAQVSNVTKALEGVVPGLQVHGNTGQPGSGLNLRIRGVGSVNATNNPLIVIDGAPFSGDLSQINTDDIESIAVLRDAASAALYGARGANGVILVTTKKGRGEAKLNFRATYGVVTRGIPEYDVMSPEEYYEAMFTTIYNNLTHAAAMTWSEDRRRNLAAGSTQAWLGGNGAAAEANGNMTGFSVLGWLGGYNVFNTPAGELINPLTGKVNVGNGSKKWNTDWESELIRPASRQEYQLSASKGDANNSWFASLAYLDEEGIVVNTGFKRITARLNTSNQIKKWVKLDAGLNATHQQQKNVATDGGTAIANPFGFIRYMPRIYPFHVHDLNTGTQIFNSDGTPMWDFGNNQYFPRPPGAQPNGTGWVNRKFSPGQNLAASLPLEESIAQVDGMNARIATELTLMEGLTLRVQGSADLRNNFGYRWMNMLYGDAVGVSGRLYRWNYKTFSTTVMEMLTYNTTIARHHNLTAMIGHESYRYSYDYFWGHKTGFPFQTNVLDLGASIQGLESYDLQHRTEGFLFNGQYDYDGKYFASASVRRDGSSRFHESNRWGTFWSVGAGWTVTREDFMKSATFVDVLRLRTSYGSQGNDGTTSYYPWMGLFSAYNNDGQTGFLATSIGNSDLKWESQKMFNVGVDFRLLKRLSGSFEAYVRTNPDMLFAKPLANSTGFTSVMENVGEMQSKGVEFQMNYDIIQRGDLRWSVGLNATHWKDKMTKMAPQDSLGLAVTGNQRIMTGHSVYEFWLREQYGVAENGQALYVTHRLPDGLTGLPPGSIGRNRDGDPTATIGNAPLYASGKTSVPVVYGGINTSVAWKGFDLSILCSYSIGGWMIDDNYMTFFHGGAVTNAYNFHKDMKGAYVVADGTHRGAIQTTINSGGYVKADGSQIGITKGKIIPQLNTAANWANNAWGVSDRYLISRSYFNLTNVTLGYTIPREVTQKIKIENVRAFVTMDNFFTKSAKKGMDPQQGFGGLATRTYFPTKTLTFGVNAQF